MERQEALDRLRSGAPRERLDAARELEASATEGDLTDLERALRQEPTAWVRRSLEDAIARIRGEHSERSQLTRSTSTDPDPAALRRITQMLVHELEPIVGTARLFASAEIAGYDTSSTKDALDQLRRLLDAFDSLSRAAAPASDNEFVLSEAVRQIIASSGLPPGVDIQLAGPAELVVLTDQGLLELVLQNGIRNAAEATVHAGEPLVPIVVAWGETDAEYWTSVMDRGVGLPLRMESAFQMGISSKEGHLGIGLALAAQAAESMGARLSLQRRTDGGALFELRWPRRIGPRA